MKYAKIIVKNDYEKRGDLVLRSYIRALKKINAKSLLNGDEAFIYGVVDDNNKFYEFFTKQIIDYHNYQDASIDEILNLSYLSLTQVDQIVKVIKNVLYNENIDFDFEISSIEDLACDRAIEFEAYMNFLSRINPYKRLTLTDNQDIYNGYNNFFYKISELKKMAKMDEQVEDYDEYNLENYYKKILVGNGERESFSYEVPKKLVRK